MKLRFAEISSMVLSLVALLFTIIAMSLQGWLYIKNYHRGVKVKYEVGPYKTCLSGDRGSHCWKYLFHSDFITAVAAFLTIGFIVLVVVVILIFLFLFLVKLKTRVVKLVIIILAFVAALCLLVAFAVWVGKWKSLGYGGYFGTGTWMCLVACIFSFITAGVSLSLSPPTQIN